MVRGRVVRFVAKATHLDDLVRLGTLTDHAAEFLSAAVASGLNVLVSGGTQAGKTTMLNCLASAIPPRERVVSCEEVFELSKTHLPLRKCGGRANAAPEQRTRARCFM